MERKTPVIPAEDVQRQREYCAEIRALNSQLSGTPLAYVVEQLEQGYDVLLEIDVQGSIQAMKAYPDAVTIFILPPNRAELRNRLIKRATETPEAISLRLRNAELELFMTKEYQYCVVNDEVDRAVSKVEAILTAESCKVSRGAQIAMDD